MESTTSDYDREKLQERLAKLSGEAWKLGAHFRVLLQHSTHMGPG
jgi:hypothetical protein